LSHLVQPPTPEIRLQNPFKEPAGTDDQAGALYPMLLFSVWAEGPAALRL
jgi:hypothetical protein